MASRAFAGAIFSMKIIRILFLVIFMTACQSSWIVNLVTQSGQPLYHDEFSDSSSGWPQAVTTNGSLGYGDGAYRILEQSPHFDLWAVSGQTFGDVQIEADATRLAGPVYNRFGLICRFQDIGHFYVFYISSDGYYAIAKVKNGTTSMLGQQMMAYSDLIKQGEGPNHLRFDCIGNTLTGMVNGQIIATASDADFTGGDAGLIAGAFDEGGVEVSFEHFVVIKP
jgi:hypothetical protein